MDGRDLLSTSNPSTSPRALRMYDQSVKSVFSLPLLFSPVSWCNTPPTPPQQATTLLVAVEDNTTVMNARAGALLDGTSGSGRCVTVSSYLEAVGVLACHKAGVNPACLTPDVPAIREMPPKPVTAEDADVGGAGGAADVGEEGRKSSTGVAVHAEGLRALVDA